MPGIILIDPSSRNHRNILEKIARRQSGVCHFCRKLITEAHTIASKSGTITKYYHVSCAKLVKLL